MNKRAKPEIFKYHDYRAYLDEVMSYMKAVDKSFKRKEFAAAIDVTPSYLSMILNGKRELSHNLIHSISKVLELTIHEETFLELLVLFKSSKGDLSKAKFLERMKKFKKYRDFNPEETKLHDYMSSWLNVVIREMTAIDGFKDDPKWIQENLKYPATIEEIKNSLKFLLDNDFIMKGKGGNFKSPDTNISCMDQVYTNALIQFHREFLKLAGDSTLYATPDERKLLGHCVALNKENIDIAQVIIQEAYDKLRALQGDEDKGDVVYFMEMAIFPLTKGESGD